MSIPSNPVNSNIKNLSQEADSLKNIKQGQKVQVTVSDGKRIWDISKGIKESGLWGKTFGRLQQSMDRTRFNKSLAGSGIEGGANREAVTHHLSNFEVQIGNLVKGLTLQDIQNNKADIKELVKNLNTVCKTATLAEPGKSHESSPLNQLASTYRDSDTRSRILSTHDKLTGHLESLEQKIKDAEREERKAQFNKIQDGGAPPPIPPRA